MNNLKKKIRNENVSHHFLFIRYYETIKLSQTMDIDLPVKKEAHVLMYYSFKLASGISDKEVCFNLHIHHVSDSR